MRTRTSTPIGIITKLMDMEPALSVGIVTLEIVGDGGGAGFGGLLKGDLARHLGVAAEDCYCEGG